MKPSHKQRDLSPLHEKSEPRQKEKRKKKEGGAAERVGGGGDLAV